MEAKFYAEPSMDETKLGILKDQRTIQFARHLESIGWELIDRRPLVVKPDIIDEMPESFNIWTPQTDKRKHTIPRSHPWIVDGMDLWKIYFPAQRPAKTVTIEVPDKIAMDMTPEQQERLY